MTLKTAVTKPSKVKRDDL